MSTTKPNIRLRSNDLEIRLLSNLYGGRLLFPIIKAMYDIKNEHRGNRTLVLGPEIPCTTTMLYARFNTQRTHSNKYDLLSME